MAKPSYAQTQYIDRLIMGSNFPDLLSAASAAGFRLPLDANEASVLIEKLKNNELSYAAPETVDTPAGGIDLETAWSMVGRRVSITGRGIFAKREDGTWREGDEETTLLIDVTELGRHDVTKLPVLTGRNVAGGTASRHWHLISSFAFTD